MKTNDIFKRKRVLSYEVFPPKRTAPVDTIYKTLEGLKEIEPDFISVTYGAGGSENSDLTFKIAAEIKQNYGMESAVHLPCIGLTREDVLQKLKELKEQKIENILALRGDIPDGYDGLGEFRYACDLIAFIKEHGDFNILAACYPEGHIESKSMAEDIHNLKRKVDAGAGHLISQLFFENESFYSFLEQCRGADIHVPVEAGIMPVVNKKQIQRMASLCGASIPKKLAAILDRYGDDSAAMRDAGIAYAIDQIADLVEHGVDGIHLYTMNQPDIAQRIYREISGLALK